MSNAARSGRGVQLRLVLDVVATLGSVVAAGALVWMIFMRPAPPQQAGRSAPPVPTEPVSLDGAPTIGAATAPIVMLEFSDFECPFCAKFVKDIWPTIKAKYVDTGQVQLAFRHLPLPIHKRAQRAAEAAVCAAEQEKFWTVHDSLFDAAGKFEDADLFDYSKRAQVSEAPFKACMAGPAATRVKEDSELAKSLKLSGTPVFLIGNRNTDGRLKVTSIIVGARPLTDFEDAFRTAAGSWGGWSGVASGRQIAQISPRKLTTRDQRGSTTR